MHEEKAVDESIKALNGLLLHGNNLFVTVSNIII